MESLEGFIRGVINDTLDSIEDVGTSIGNAVILAAVILGVAIVIAAIIITRF